jgi:hypothetical protein
MWTYRISVVVILALLVSFAAGCMGPRGYEHHEDNGRHEGFERYDAPEHHDEHNDQHHDDHQDEHHDDDHHGG